MSCIPGYNDRWTDTRTHDEGYHRTHCTQSSQNCDQIKEETTDEARLEGSDHTDYAKHEQNGWGYHEEYDVLNDNVDDSE